MADLSQFHLLQPWALLSAPILFAVAWWALQQQQGKVVWKNLFNAELLPRFLTVSAGSQTRIAVILALVVSILLSIALSQPVWRKAPQPVYQTESALVIALDLSASMNAEDIVPSRLKQARFKIRDLLSARQDGQTALLVYAGDAFTVAPLTDDSETIESQLNALQPEIMPVQGSRPERALALAEQLLTQAGIASGEVLMVTDEVNSDALEDAVNALTRKGHRLSVMSVGTAEGAPVPGLKYRNGKPVIAPTDFHEMQQVANLGGGIALTLTSDNSDIRKLTELYDRTSLQSDAKLTDQQSDQWLADGPLFILLALPLLLPLFRRGVLSVATLALVTTLTMAPSKQAMAFGWEDLWQTADQQAMQQWQAGDKSAAAERFERADWQQAAQYSTGNYQQALDSLPEPETADQWYNRANTLARLGQFEEALAAYDQALTLNPGDEDTQANRKIVEDALKQLQQHQQQQPDQNQKSENSDSQQRNQSNQQQGQDQQQGSDSANQNSGNDGQQQENQSGSRDQQTDQQRSSESMPSQQESDQQGQGAQESAMSEAEKAEQQRQFSQALDHSKEAQDPNTQAAMAQSENQPLNEQQQAREQLLNRVIDDPAGLWRRKFLYQYQQQAQPQQPGEKPW